jgi:hypothetical protein
LLDLGRGPDPGSTNGQDQSEEREAEGDQAEGEDLGLIPDEGKGSKSLVF